MENAYSSQVNKVLRIIVCLIVIPQFLGCGTILYPERKGQRDGRVDAKVAILDGIGLLFFLVPGVIAYAVDFSNGTIYLPPGSYSMNEIVPIKKYKFDPNQYTDAMVEKMIKEQTGRTVKIDGRKLKVKKIKSIKELKKEFGQTLPTLEVVKR